MALYPSLEDMKIDQLARAQSQAEYHYVTRAMHPPKSEASLPYAISPASEPSSGMMTGLYPALNDFMGLELSEAAIASNMPQYAVAVPAVAEVTPMSTSGPLAGMVAPLSGQSLGLQRAQVTHGIRELTLCKDRAGKVGLRVHAINNGIFVCLVSKGSPAAISGLRFGDQILQVNGTLVAGYTMDKVHDLFRKSPVNGIHVAVRDRPFERTVTLHKDSVGHVGFHFKGGKIIGLVQDSSAARNGLLTEHHLLEVNGQNVIGIKDKEITALIDEGGPVITVTVIPSFVYEHMVKKMAPSLMKFSMDHSVPDM